MASSGPTPLPSNPTPTIAHFGRGGSFTHEAARTRFGPETCFLPCESIGGVFSAVEQRRAGWGVIPIENSLDGSIAETTDLLATASITIVGEIEIQIRHHLLAQIPLESIERIYSRDTVFRQSSRWLEAHLAKVERIEVASTTMAADRAAADDGGAALGPTGAGRPFGLQALVCDIQDDPTNTTRFAVLGPPGSGPEPTGHDRTSLVVALADRPGALRSS